MRSTSASGAKTAAILPLSSIDTRLISRPRALTASSASANGSAAGGDQGAVLAQAVAHHHVGRDAVGGEQAGERGVGGEHRRLRDRGLAQILLGARRPRAGSTASTKMKSLSGLPSSGVITRSASANTAATIGSRRRSSASMLTYCEPWPV